MLISKMIRTLIFLLILLKPITSFSGELETRSEIKNNVKALFYAGNYEQLNKIGSSYRDDKLRTSSGLWKLTLYSVGLSSIPNTKIKDSNYWLNLKKRSLKWLELDNKSSFAHLFYVDILINEAWMHRGSGWAYNVRKENWEPFYETIEEAKKYLIKNREINEVDPRWYEKMLTIAKAQSWDEGEFHDLLNEALNKYPQFYEIYFRAINYLQPRWHGSVEEIENFARYASKKNGNGMYARIYWYVSQAEFGNELFTKSKARWADMKLGIDDVISVYPDQWNINNFALFSCLAKDKEMTGKLINMIQGEPMIKVWRDAKFFDYCQSFNGK